MSACKKNSFGKIVIMVVAVFLSIATVALSAICIPDLIAHINNNQKQEIVSKIHNAYISGDYDSAKEYALEIADYIKKDGNKVAEDYVKLIELKRNQVNRRNVRRSLRQVLVKILVDFYVFEYYK